MPRACESAGIPVGSGSVIRRGCYRNACPVIKQFQLGHQIAVALRDEMRELCRKTVPYGLPNHKQCGRRRPANVVVMSDKGHIGDKSGYGIYAEKRPASFSPSAKKKKQWGSV